MRTAIEWDYGILPPSSIKHTHTHKTMIVNARRRPGLNKVRQKG